LGTLTVLGITGARAQAPEWLNYQGRLLSGTNLAQGEWLFVFSLYDAPTGGARLYQETQSVTVVDGFYATQIGHAGGLAAALSGDPVYLELQVAGTPLAPRERIGSVAHALTAVRRSGDTMTGPISNLQAATMRLYPVTLVKGGFEIGYPNLATACRELEDNCEVRIHPGMHVVTAGCAYGETAAYASNAAMWVVGRSNVLIRGIGYPTLASTTYGDYLAIFGSDNIRVQGLRFVGLGPGQSNAVLFAMIALMSTNRNITIRDCSFENFGDHGISHLFGPKISHYVTIDNCYFSNGGTAQHPTLGTDGAAISGVGSHWQVLGNRMERVLRGIEIQTDWTEPIGDILIANNIIEYASLGIMTLGPAATNYQDITVVNNVLSTCSDFPGVAAANSAAIYLFGRRINIVGNVIHGYGDAGILCGPMDTPFSDSVIANNIVHSNAGAYADAAIRLDGSSLGTSNNLISGNLISHYHIRGIDVSSDNTLINANLIGYGSPDGGAAIRIHTNNAPARGVTIQNNLMHGATTGIELDAGVTGVIIQGNTILGPTYWPHGYLSDQGHNTILLRQQLTNNYYVTTENQDFKGGLTLGGVWTNQWPQAHDWMALPLPAATPLAGLPPLSGIVLTNGIRVRCGGLPQSADRYDLRATLHFSPETNSYNLTFYIMGCDTNGERVVCDAIELAFTNEQAASGRERVEWFELTTTNLSPAWYARQLQIYNRAEFSTGIVQLLNMEYRLRP